MSKWYRQASVRTAPRRLLEKGDQYRYFSTTVAPLLTHEVFFDLSIDRLQEVEIQLLYKYLRFTEYLETKLVNKVILKIFNDEYSLGFPDKLRKEAYKIYCDEAYHALQAADMIEQIEEVSGVAPLKIPVDIDAELKQLEAIFPTEIAPYFDLFFVSVAENLVSQELNGYIKDKSIHPQILALMRDHARDEMAHAQFFRDIMHQIYLQIGEQLFEQFVGYIPQFLEAYLIPSSERMHQLLKQQLDEHQCQKVISYYLAPEQVHLFLQKSSVELYKAVNKIRVAS